MIVHGCANHDTEGKRFKFPHPLLWRNEATLLHQRRTMYFPLALFAYTVCCRRIEQCFSVLRTHKSDAVDGSSGRRYVTDQWHNVPLLRARVIVKWYSGTNVANILELKNPGRTSVGKLTRLGIEPEPFALQATTRRYPQTTAVVPEVCPSVWK